MEYGYFLSFHIQHPIFNMTVTVPSNFFLKCPRIDFAILGDPEAARTHQGKPWTPCSPFWKGSGDADDGHHHPTPQTPNTNHYIKVGNYFLMALRTC